MLAAVACVREELEGADHPPRPDRWLDAGVVVDTALGGWEVVEAPGHCPSQVCLFQRESRLLFSADLLMPDFTTYCDIGASADPIGDFVDAVERVGALGARVAFGGHGRPLDDVPALIALYRAGIAGRLDAVAAALDGAPATTLDVMRAVFGEQDLVTSAAWRFLEAHVYLVRLARTGRAGGSRVAGAQPAVRKTTLPKSSPSTMRRMPSVASASAKLESTVGSMPAVAHSSRQPPQLVARTHRDALDAELIEEDAGELGVDVRAAGRAHGDQQAAGLERAQRVLERRLADAVHHRVDALGQPLAVGERGVGAELGHGAGALGLAAARDPGAQAARLPERDERGGEPTARALDQHGRPRGQVPAAEQHPVGGQPRGAEAGGGVPAQLRRLGHEVAPADRDPLANVPSMPSEIIRRRGSSVSSPPPASGSAISG